MNYGFTAGPSRERFTEFRLDQRRIDISYDDQGEVGGTVVFFMEGLHIGEFRFADRSQQLFRGRLAVGVAGGIYRARKSVRGTKVGALKLALQTAGELLLHLLQLLGGKS